MDQTFNSLVTKPPLKVAAADPWDVVPVKNNKYAKDTKEVHLGKRDAQVLVNFPIFENLETVWLNNNRLRDLSGLEQNFRIKHLYVQKNRIAVLKGVIDRLGHLETLILYDNELRDLDDVLTVLKPLSNLKHLGKVVGDSELFENPVAEEPNYKIRVLAAIPTLELFDRHKVSYQEKEHARKFMKGSKRK